MNMIIIGHHKPVQPKNHGNLFRYLFYGITTSFFSESQGIFSESFEMKSLLSFPIQNVPSKKEPKFPWRNPPEDFFLDRKTWRHHRRPSPDHLGGRSAGGSHGWFGGAAEWFNLVLVRKGSITYKRPMAKRLPTFWDYIHLISREK